MKNACTQIQSDKRKNLGRSPSAFKLLLLLISLEQDIIKG